MATILKNIKLTYIKFIQLPTIYRNNNLLFIFIILVMIFSTFLFNSGIIYNYINYAPIFFEFTILFTMLYFLFLVFNLIVRSYHMFYRTLIYFYKIKGCRSKSLITLYYIYNGLCLFISIIIMYKIFNNIIFYKPNLIGYLYTYSFLISFTLALMYIDSISHENIVVHNRIITIKLWFFKLLLLFPIYAFLTELFINILNNIVFNYGLSELLSIKLYLMNDDETINPDENTNNIEQVNTNIQDNERNSNKQRNTNKQSGIVNRNEQVNDSIQVNQDKNINTSPILLPSYKTYLYYIQQSYIEMVKLFEDNTFLKTDNTESNNYQSLKELISSINNNSFGKNIFNNVINQDSIICKQEEFKIFISDDNENLIEDSPLVENNTNGVYNLILERNKLVKDRGLIYKIIDSNSYLSSSNINDVELLRILNDKIEVLDKIIAENKASVENKFLKVENNGTSFANKFLKNFEGDKGRLNKKLSASNLNFLINKPLDPINEPSDPLDDVFGNDEDFADLFYTK
jgi:hypothetical protein